MAEADTGGNIEQKTEKGIRGRVVDVLLRIHQDVFDKAARGQVIMSESTEVEEVAPGTMRLKDIPVDANEYKAYSGQVLRLLYDMLQEQKGQGDDLHARYWTSDIRKDFPAGTDINLVGLRGEYVLTPKKVPLRRPEVFLNMYESFLKTGDVPQELIDDDYEREEDEMISAALADELAMEGEDLDTVVKEYLYDIEQARTVEKLVGILAVTSGEDRSKLAAAGVFKKLDEKAQRLILDEITAGMKEHLEQGIGHLKKFRFSDESIAESLQLMIDAQVAKSESIIYAPPSNATPWERRAAQAERVADLAALAGEIAESPRADEPASRSSRRTIDTLAKNMLVRSANDARTLDEFKQLNVDAANFPFSTFGDEKEVDYKNDVLDIIETHAKNLMLGEIQKEHTIDELFALQVRVAEFPFRHPDNVRWINDEFIIRREELRGNPPISRQQIIEQREG